ncbi:SagB/ThcOx family dehydrogenase [Streptomyces sp. NPDC001595]|uniref:SagB/ThcOx family dehydrogenase n=1 Tax=Streptomyces sp. NPDC001532 TaxID=3154520 RepID=UPI00332F322F
MDLVTALARARSAEPPGPDTPAGPAVHPWPGPPLPLPTAAPGELDVGRLLRLSLAASDASGRLRPAASAGALHPVDARLVVGDGCPLPPGRYGYDPLRHRVHRLGPAPEGTPPGVRVELSVTARRTVSHYGHRACPLLLLDTGHAAGAVWLAARALGARPTAVRLDGHDGERLAALHFTPPDPLVQDVSPTARPAPDEHPTARPSMADPPTARPAEYQPPAGRPAPAVRPNAQPIDNEPLPAHPAKAEPPPAQRPEPSRPTVPHPEPSRPTVPHPEPSRPTVPRPEPSRPSVPAPRELLGRRSAPPPLRGVPPVGVLRAVLAAAVEASAGEPAWCVAVGAPRPGLLAPGPDGTLRRLAAGEARPTLAAWAAGQAWLAEAGAVLLGHGCPSDADAPRIRRIHLRAGFAAHLAQVTAVRHGLASRPVGSWQRADLGAALGGAPGRDWIVHGLALGTTHSEQGTS